MAVWLFAYWSAATWEARMVQQPLCEIVKIIILLNVIKARHIPDPETIGPLNGVDEHVLISSTYDT